MPGTTAGVYTGALTAGTEVSSTYEGRHLTVRDDELIHPVATDTFVNKGDPVIVCDAGAPGTYGRIVGVAFADGTAAADWIAIDTEGIFNLPIYADDDAGGSDIEIGDPLFIRAGHLTGVATLDGLGDAEISKRRNLDTQVFFGYALGSLTSGGAGVIAIKVHAAPEEQQDEFITWLAAHAVDFGKFFRIQDNTTLATGYPMGVSIRYDQAGVKTGDTTPAALGIESYITAAVPAFDEFSLYRAAIANITVGRLTSIEIYNENRGNAVASQYDIMIGRNSNAVLTGPGNDAFIYFREHSTVQEESCVFMLQGNNAAEYLFCFGSNPDTGLLLLEANASAHACDYRVRCNTTVGVRWLHLHTE